MSGQVLRERGVRMLLGIALVCVAAWIAVGCGGAMTSSVDQGRSAAETPDLVVVQKGDGWRRGWFDIAELSGRNRRHLTPPPTESSPHVDFAPAFSPDGRQVAFSRARPDATASGGPSQLFVVSAAGGEARATGGSRSGGDEASWSPDSRHIAYGTNGTCLPRPAIGVADTRTGRAWRFATPHDRRTWPIPHGLIAYGASSAINWSPNGRRLLYVLWEAAGPPKPPYPNALCRFAYGGSLFVTDPHGRSRILISRSTTITDAAWSPDGDQIAYADCPNEDENVGLRCGVWLVRADGRERQRLIADVPSTVAIRVLWPPGNELLITRGPPNNWTEGYGRVLSFDLERHVQRTLVRGTDSVLAISPSGERLAFAGDERTVVLSRDGRRWSFNTGWPEAVYLR